jgi:predicted dehydrogenase
MLNGALLGAGNVAFDGHLPGWAEVEGVAIVAAADPRTDLPSELAERLPLARWYRTAEELLAAEELDFVDVCAPPAMHFSLVALALENGLHVLCEKPLVLDPRELRALGARAREAGRVVYTVHNWKFAPILARTAELVHEGAVGEVTRCRWETLRTQPAVTVATAAGNWRLDPLIAGGGILIDHGWHALYVVNDWLGADPVRVEAVLETRKHSPFAIEDTATLRLETPAAAAEIFLTWAAEERRNRAVVEGTEGTLRLDGATLALDARGAGRASAEWTFPQSLTEGSHHPDWFAGVARGFLREIAEPYQRGRNLEEAALCATLIALAKESSAAGRAMDVPEARLG